MAHEDGQPRRIRTSRHPRRALATVTVAATALLGAAAVTGTGAADARATGITYTSKTVLVPTATLKSQLLSVSPNGATYTFRSAKGVLSKIKSGKVMLLQNLAVRDVTKTATSKGHLVVSSKPSAITDLISNGTLAWSKTINFTKGFALGGPAVPQARRADSLAGRFGLTPMADGGGFTLKGKTDSYDYSVNFTPTKTGLAVKITISKDKPVEIEATITGTLKNLKTAGNISVNHGKLSSAKLLANSLQGQFTLAYSAKPISGFGLGKAGGIKITLPAEIAVPFFVGPVPMFLGVKTAFFASAGFSGFNQELSGSWTLDYDGQGGFTASSSGATSPSGALRGLGDIILKAANAVKTGPLSFIFGAQMPQLELGLGVKGLDVAGNVTLIGSTGIATQGSGCDTRMMEIQGDAGAEANFFGFSAGGSATLFDKKYYKSYPAGCGTFPG